MAVADAEGKFVLKELAPGLIFRLLVVADGYVPAYSSKAFDPAGGAVDFKLKAHDLDRRDPERVFRARIVNDSGQPVEGAMVEVSGFQRGKGAPRYRGLLGFDPLAVSNARGEVRLGVAEKGDKICLRVSSPGLAPRCFDPLPAGSKSHDLELGPGVTVKGQVLKEGKPLGGVTLGLVEHPNLTSKSVGDFKISTDERGHFVFLNVPPNGTYALYGLMESLRPYGTIPVELIRVAGHGTVKDVGRISVQRGYRVSGRVVLADGKPLPAGLRLVLSRARAWDSPQTVTLPRDGSFTFTSVPKERCHLMIHVPGYHPSPKNGSFDMLSGGLLAGRVEADIDDLRFLLDSGPRPQIDYGSLTTKDFAEAERRRDQPLKGAPSEQPGKR
ncbi:MAG TPA: hypothetical protein VKU02_33335 [Gemmataceae bacterium]|nr:hypothetical protein [Gemmataceae bacterium]